MGQKFDFDVLYATYPNKEGKRRGMDKLQKTIKTQADYLAFKGALENYIKLCERTNRISRGFVKQWGTFVNNWTDYLQDLSTPSGTRTQLERIEKGEL